MTEGRWWCFSDEDYIEIGIGREGKVIWNFWKGFMIGMLYVLLDFPMIGLIPRARRWGK